MPRVRLRDTFRTSNGIAVPGADPSIRLRGEFVEVSEEELERLRSAIKSSRFPALSLDNLDVDEREPNEEIEATEAAIDLALENDVDIGEVEGSGKDGRVLKSDVQSHIA